MDPRFHVAAEIPKDTVRRNPEFTIGDNKTYGIFYNGPLMKNQNYKIYTAFVSRVDRDVSHWLFFIVIFSKILLYRSNFLF